MVASVPPSLWNVGHHRIRAYVHQNRPVITATESADVNPVGVVSVIASKTLQGAYQSTERSPWDLYVAIAAQAQTEAGGPTPQRSPEPASPTVTGCACGEHLVEVAEQVVPFAAAGEAENAVDTPVTVADLVEAETLGRRKSRTSPTGWMLWFGDETRAHYDDDAPMSLEDVVAMAPGVSKVVREDRETILVRALGRCEDAMVAVAARALLDHRVQVPSGPRPVRLTAPTRVVGHTHIGSSGNWRRQRNAGLTGVARNQLRGMETVPRGVTRAESPAGPVQR